MILRIIQEHAVDSANPGPHTFPQAEDKGPDASPQLRCVHDLVRGNLHAADVRPQPKPLFFGGVESTIGRAAAVVGAVDLLKPTPRALVKRADQAGYLLKHQVLKCGKGLYRVCGLPQPR